jgi:hypothetical protein
MDGWSYLVPIGDIYQMVILYGLLSGLEDEICEGGWNEIYLGK